jgi:hypothetical protein
MGSSGTTGGSASAGSASAGGSQVTGKVDKIDQSKKELSLKLKVDESTQIMKDGQRATLSDIKEGDQVRASFSGGEVQRIDVMSGGGSGRSGSSGSSGSSSSPGSSGSSSGTGSSGSSGSGSSSGHSGGSSGSSGKGY